MLRGAFSHNPSMSAVQQQGRPNIYEAMENLKVSHLHSDRIQISDADIWENLFMFSSLSWEHQLLICVFRLVFIFPFCDFRTFSVFHSVVRLFFFSLHWVCFRRVPEDVYKSCWLCHIISHWTLVPVRSTPSQPLTRTSCTHYLNNTLGTTAFWEL